MVSTLILLRRRMQRMWRMIDLDKFDVSTLILLRRRMQWIQESFCCLSVSTLILLRRRMQLRKLTDFCQDFKFQLSSSFGGGCNARTRRDHQQSFNSHPPSEEDATSDGTNTMTITLTFQLPSSFGGGCNHSCIKSSTS